MKNVVLIKKVYMKGATEPLLTVYIFLRRSTSVLSFDCPFVNPEPDQTDRHTDRQTRQTYRQTEIQTDRMTDRTKDRQTDRLTI